MSMKRGPATVVAEADHPGGSGGDIEAQLLGLERDGKTAMLVALDQRLAGIIAVADTIKDNAIEAVADLARQACRS